MAFVAALLAVALAAVAAAWWRRERAHAREHDRLGRVLRDSAPRAELSEALASREAVMAAAPGPVLLYDETGTMIRANGAARAEALDMAELEAHAGLRAAVRACVAGGGGQELEITLYTPSRRRFAASVRGYAAGDRRGAAVALSDQSMQADFRDARSLFSAGVSHELRTPLQRILALVETLALPLTEDERAQMIASARAEVDAMRRLIEDMILLVRLESHELAASGEQADVQPAVEASVERHAASAADRSMTLVAAANRGLVAAIAPRLLDAVLDNLVENAVRHAGAGERIEVRARGLSGAVEIVVHDTGGRIPPEHVARVFERFHRVEDARSGPGTGLGLAIVKHIAEEYGGRATAESSPEAGTTLRVVLPAPGAVRD